jgi:hypothetical protein
VTYELFVCQETCYRINPERVLLKLLTYNPI